MNTALINDLLAFAALIAGLASAAYEACRPDTSDFEELAGF